MHVVHICATSLTVPPSGYGGTERLVFWLAREQQRMGLQVSVIAHPDSAVAKLLPGVRLIACDRHLDPTPMVPNDADVLHLHRFPHDGRAPDRPYLITEHGLRKSGAGFLPNTVFVSRAHARLHGSDVFVSNGVPVGEYTYSEHKSDAFLFMARMEWPRKNARTALDLAVDTGIPLHITGQRSPWLERRVWGHWMLSPRKARSLIRPSRYVDGADKAVLLSQAFALFHIVNWHEPFSLVAHEALASGTPVIASPNGALADFVVDGHNGALVRSYDEARDALRRLATLDAPSRCALAARCRDSASSARACAEGYVELYEDLVAGRSLGSGLHSSADNSPAAIHIQRPSWPR